MNSHKEKDFYRKKNSKRKAAKNITEETIQDKLFTTRGSSCKYESKKITDYSAMSHMVTTEKYIKLSDVENQVTKIDSGKITGTKHGDWHSYRNRDRKSIA